VANVEITEFRRGRNFIRVGDRVHVKPSRPGKKDGFDSKVRRILANPDGTPQALEVTDPRNGAIRTLRPERIERRRQAVNGKKVEVR
jgi:hypothetical protein